MMHESEPRAGSTQAGMPREPVTKGAAAPTEPPYHPISCAFHDRLLALATLRRECAVEYLEGEEHRRIRARIADVYSRSGAEYLRLGTGEVIRLDRLLAVDGERLHPSC